MRRIIRSVAKSPRAFLRLKCLINDVHGILLCAQTVEMKMFARLTTCLECVEFHSIILILLILQRC